MFHAPILLAALLASSFTTRTPLTSTSLPTPAARRHTPLRVVALAPEVLVDPAASGRAVAEWCMATGREQATVAVSSASSLPGVLCDFWAAARQFSLEDGERGRQRVLALPCWDEGAGDVLLFQKLLQHILDCAGLCEYVGETMLVAGRHPSAQPHADEPAAAPCPVLLLRSFTQKQQQTSPAETDDDDPYAAFSSAYDPYAGVAEDDGAAAPAERASDADVLLQTREWVTGIIVEMKVCPFSSTADRAGMPIGGVTYPITHASTGEEVYEAFWGQVLELRRTDEKELSTILLLTPDFGLHSAEGYEEFANSLNGALTDLDVERELQLVFFHPDYAFRDGKERLGGDGAANYARRSPFPMINLLRTPQVRAAQKGLPTGSVYTTNENNLERVGAAELQRMLEVKDWSELASYDFARHSENLWK